MSYLHFFVWLLIFKTTDHSFSKGFLREPIISWLSLFNFQRPNRKTDKLRITVSAFLHKILTYSIYAPLLLSQLPCNTCFWQFHLSTIVILWWFFEKRTILYAFYEYNAAIRWYFYGKFPWECDSNIVSHAVLICQDIFYNLFFVFCRQRFIS